MKAEGGEVRFVGASYLRGEVKQGSEVGSVWIDTIPPPVTMVTRSAFVLMISDGAVLVSVLYCTMLISILNDFIIKGFFFRAGERRKGFQITLLQYDTSYEFN